MIPLTEDRKMLGYELLASYPGISCFVTTRHGGKDITQRIGVKLCLRSRRVR